MTIRLKAPRFNIRRPDPGAQAAPAPAPRVITRPQVLDDMPFATHDDGFGDQVFPGAAKADAPVPANTPTPAADSALDAIRKEGLTGRQLRVARRLAQRHNLPATSDYDAVRLLRQAGIDPFQRSSMLELVTPETAEAPPPPPPTPPASAAAR